MTTPPFDREYLVLIIEDSPTDRKIYRRYLEAQKLPRFRIVEAATGKAGLAACESDDDAPDCILVDYRLPDTQGTLLIPQLLKLTSAPIILVTGHLGPSVQTEGYRVGAVRYLSKDLVSSVTLISAIHEALGISAQFL